MISCGSSRHRSTSNDARRVVAGTRFGLVYRRRPRYHAQHSPVRPCLRVLRAARLTAQAPVHRREGQSGAAVGYQHVDGQDGVVLIDYQLRRAVYVEAVQLIVSVLVRSLVAVVQT